MHESENTHAIAEKPMHPQRVTIWRRFWSDHWPIIVNMQFQPMQPKRMTIWCRIWNPDITESFFPQNAVGGEIPQGHDNVFFMS